MSWFEAAFRFMVGAKFSFLMANTMQKSTVLFWKSICFHLPQLTMRRIGNFNRIMQVYTQRGQQKHGLCKEISILWSGRRDLQILIL